MTVTARRTDPPATTNDDGNQGDASAERPSPLATAASRAAAPAQAEGEESPVAPDGDDPADALPTGHLVYIVRCANGALYAGYTTDLARRLAAHNAGRGGHYTRAHRPVALVAAWTFADKGEALRAEATLKRHSRAVKLALVRTGAFLGQLGLSFPERLDHP